MLHLQIIKSALLKIRPIDHYKNGADSQLMTNKRLKTLAQVKSRLQNAYLRFWFLLKRTAPQHPLWKATKRAKVSEGAYATASLNLMFTWNVVTKFTNKLSIDMFGKEYCWEWFRNLVGTLLYATSWAYHDGWLLYWPPR